ncbi:hypothetical protein SLE2022_214350 [Rubroshorea leprosula]
MSRRLRRPANTLSKDQLREIFKNHSADQSNVKLGREELKAAFEQLGAQLPSYQAACALKYLNSDKDQYITEDELGALVDYAYPYGFRG